MELGTAEAPKVKHKGGRPRGSGKWRGPEVLTQERPPKLNRTGKVEVELSVPPSFTALAALHAEREKTTTKAIVERWVTEAVADDEPKPFPAKAG
ncbi:hypothetical protein [Haloferula sp. BvORR071]|uniref:hypothetical protein n=1 Tax=Haloferula sp. BvORR071 TaxID=1396141 RepID=UPI0005528D6E|nr:hypothetical protein [Haloferula sp. BvORR071]